MTKFKNDKLDTTIRELIGNHTAMVAEFRSIVLEIHREMEQAVVQRNCALRQVMAQFGMDDARIQSLGRQLAAGADHDNVKCFDEMAEYAAAHYPFLLCKARGESDCGSHEERMMKVLIDGIQPVPRAFDDAVLHSALSQVGQEFFDSYSFETIEPNVDDDGIQKRITNMEKYHALVLNDIDVEIKGGPKIGWPQYRLKRLQNLMVALPEEYHATAVERTKFVALKAMVEEHIGKEVKFAKELRILETCAAPF